MSHCHAKSLLIVLLIITGTHTFAQTGNTSNPTNGRENNPYTKYGIGELRNGNNVALRGMGNITSAYANPYQLNTDNPASYSFLQRTTFELGASGVNRSIHGKINGTDLTYKTGTASVSYMTLGVPIGKRGGFVFGFRPYSNIYYKLQDTISKYISTPPSPIGQARIRYEGEGAMNEAFAGGSVRYKGLSIGFNIGYIFGNIRNSALLVPIDTYAVNNAFVGEYSTYTRMGGLHWKGGLQYEKKLDSNYTLRIGGTITIGQPIKQHYSEYHISSYNFQDTITRDTSYNVTSQTGNLELPLSYSIGVMFLRNGKWAAGIDYTATDWTTFHSELNQQMNKGIGTGSYKLSVGGEYTPDINNIRRYLSRCTYRLGGYYGTDYWRVNNNSLPYYGVTAGFSMPFRRSLSQVHFAIDGGVLGTTDNGLTKQNYIRFSLGISLNDLWFLKSKLQ